jgi:SPP1 gp7 family putative phage head morphogenesis protein
MPYSKAQRDRLLAPRLIARKRMPSLSARLSETVIKRKLFALEDATVRAQFDLYRQAFAAIRYEAENAPQDREWPDRVNAAASRVIARLKVELAATALQSALVAFRGGYYGRAWVLDMATRPDVKIAAPPVSALDGVLGEAVDWAREQEADLIRSLMGEAWQVQFADELDVLIPQIRIAIRTGQAEGEGIDAIMRRVRRVMGVETDRRRGGVGSNERRLFRANFNRVQTITRTVTNKAANTGAWQAYQRNQDVLTGYEIIVSRDERLCDVCAPLDGKQFRLSDTFRPPFHPNCILPGNEVVLPGVLVGGVKSFYSGRCVEITLDSGCGIRVTQNHPILTDRGWVRAQFIRKGEQVVTAQSDGQRIAASINPDDDHIPTVIEQVFRALEESRGMASRSMEVSAEDFHGDGRFMDRHVNVVNVDSLLLGDVESTSAQTASESDFGRCSTCGASLNSSSTALQVVNGSITSEYGAVGSINHIGAFVGAGLIPSELHTGALAARFDTGFQQTAANDGTRHSEIGGEALFTFTGEVASNQIAGGLYAESSQGNAQFVEARIDEMPADPTLAREFLDRFASEITLNEVVEVVEFDFAGHVYDLQVEPYQLYICNGVVVKNCRCTVIPTISPDLAANFSEAPRETFEEWAAGRGLSDLWDFKPTQTRMF